MALTEQQVENIQIDHGLVFVNYGETDQKQLGPTRGGGEFTVTKSIRDIEYDGRKGKTKGLQVVDEIDAQLALTHLDASLETLQLAMPYATLEGDKITCGNSAVGIIEEAAYLKNVTMFAKVVGGGYKKITLYNALSEADFTLSAAPKGEGEMPLEVFAHWDAYDDTALLYEIEDVVGITSGDPFTVTLSGGEEELLATFSKAIRAADITAANFQLLEVGVPDPVGGALAYTAAENKVTFTPTTALTAGDYIWIVSGVRSAAGDKLATTTYAIEVI